MKCEVLHVWAVLAKMLRETLKCFLPFRTGASIKHCSLCYFLLSGKAECSGDSRPAITPQRKQLQLRLILFLLLILFLRQQ